MGRRNKNKRSKTPAKPDGGPGDRADSSSGDRVSSSGEKGQTKRLTSIGQLLILLALVACIGGFLAVRYATGSARRSEAAKALDSRRLVLADELFRSGGAREQGRVESMVGRARVARLQLDQDRARELLQQARLKHPDSEAVRREALLLEIQSGRARELYQHFDRLLQNQEDDATAVWEAYAMGLEVANDDQGVRDISKRWLDKQPDCALAHAKNAEIAYFDDDLETSESLFASAARLDGDLLQAHVGLARVASLLDKKRDVLRHCEQVLRLDPENLEIRLRKAKCLLVVHRDDEAVEEFKRVLQDEPQNFSARFDLVSHYVKNERPESAIEFLQPIVPDFQHDVAVNYLMATAYQQLGDSEAAEPFLQRHLDARTELNRMTEMKLKTKPSQQDFVFCRLLGLTYLKYQWDSAEHWLHQAVTMNPNDPDVLDAVGVLAKRRGDEETAEGFHQRAQTIRAQTTGAR